jgi:glycosyltransferase involved in cell wall biosynthesis
MRWCQVEETDGVRVVRVPSYIAHGKSAVKRLMSYASFSFVAFFYSLFLAKRPDVVYSYYPPMLGGIVGAALGLFKRSPLIYDVQDLWPEALVATGVLHNKAALTLIDNIISWIYRRSAAIVVLSDGYRDSLIEKGVPKEKIFRIYNWCDESRFANLDVVKREKSSFFDIVYAGNLGSAQALHFVMDAADLLGQARQERIRFVFFGDGIESDRLKKITQDRNLKNVVFKGHVSPEVVSSELQLADALLVHLADDPLFSITIPSKTQAYLAAGKPILMAVKGESAAIISQAGAGVVAKPCDAEAIAKAAVELADSSREQLGSFGAHGEEFYRAYMSQKNGIDQVSKIVISVCGSGGNK